MNKHEYVTSFYASNMNEQHKYANFIFAHE